MACETSPRKRASEAEKAMLEKKKLRLGGAARVLAAAQNAR